MVIKGNFESYPSHFLLQRINFFPSTNNPESCHRWENIVVLEIRKRNSTVWEWSWMSFSCTIFNLRTKTFLRELQKSDYFSIPPPPLTYHTDWTLISPEKLYLPDFLKKVVSQFPERNLPSITKVSAPLDGWVEPDEGFVATEYKKESQVTKKKIIPTILIYDNITLYLI